MKKFTSYFLATFLVILYSLFFPGPAYPYYDPGSLTYFLQILVVVLAGGLLAIKIFWKNIKQFITGIFSKNPPADNPEPREIESEGN